MVKPDVTIEIDGWIAEDPEGWRAFANVNLGGGNTLLLRSTPVPLHVQADDLLDKLQITLEEGDLKTFKKEWERCNDQ